MIKANIKTIASAAALAVATFASAGTAQAQTVAKTVSGSENSGESGTVSNSGNFYTYFASKLVSGKLEVFSNNDRYFRVNWNANNGDYGSDIVTGMGYLTGSDSRSLKYRLLSWTGNEKSSVGAYGWKCPTRSANRITEYYVVNSWGGTTRYVPWDQVRNREATPVKTSKGTDYTFESDGSKYRLYKTRRLNAGHGCGTGRTDFDQFWSVRTGSMGPSSKSTKTISMSNHFSQWRSKLGATGGANGYQIIGVEGLNNSSGSAKIDVE